MARIACILVADFAVAAIVRANSELRDQPVALSISPEGHAELIAVSPRAKGLGARPGMTVAQARSLAPDLILARPSPAAETAAHDALLDAAESFSPLVEDGGSGRAYIDLAGLQRLCGDEDSMAAELARRAARVGMEAAVGIASSKEVAYLAAQCGGQRVIPLDKEREFLDWLPLDGLDLGADRGLDQTLARWGIRRLGELARIDVRALGSRLGAGGVELARLARDEKRAPFVSRPRAELFAETIELDYGIEMLEPLGFVMRPMLDRLTARLELRGLVAGDMALSLGLSGGSHDERRIAVAAPTNEVRSLLTLLILSLEASPPPAALEAIRIAVAPRVPRASQADMFLPPSPAPDRLQTTIARLAALCGPDHVGTIMAVNSHRPEAAEVVAFDPAAALSPRAASAAPLLGSHDRGLPVPPGAARLVIRAIRPAAEVETMCTRGGVPEFVRGDRVCARVVSISGPWRRQGEWWLAGETVPNGGSDNGIAPPDRNGLLSREKISAFARDYYDVALADGGVYRMFCDLRLQRWYIDGVYD